jgi:hypothetical protein
MYAVALVLVLIATPALADVTGVASAIDGDTIKVHGQRIRDAVGVAPGTRPDTRPACAPGKAFADTLERAPARGGRWGARGRPARAGAWGG